MQTFKIRQMFFDYFSSQGHHINASSSLVPTNDATLLFTNAGMVQFKDIFLGVEERSYNCAVSIQRCLRAGGKHNDLENVGYTARHHTFFEMLGNFSFGAYFKREAIHYAWDFLTKILQLPIERLWVTVYKDDEEAADIWLNDIKIAKNRFVRCDEKDNFWSMGDTGPCGPCSEIFYDHGSEINGGPPGSLLAEGDRYVEIWNLVFMQFNRDKEGILHPLPKPSVDTGMGLERIAAVLQGVHNNYEIDSFQYLITALKNLIKNKNSDKISLNVIVDHIRACSFLIADGVLPSNEGRGYVLRRIIRRAVRHGNKLGFSEPFFWKLVTPLIEIMGDAYPELAHNKKQIEQTLIQEEQQFERTLSNGLRLLKEQMTTLSKQLPGDLIFKLYDTYGFPFDLTADFAREQGFTVDQEGFDKAMQAQRNLSQKTNTFAKDYSLTTQLKEGSYFEGYEKDKLESTIIAIICDDLKVESLTTGVKAAIVLAETAFYPESGGQVGDRGKLILISKHHEAIFQVADTQRIGQAILHYGELLKGKLHMNELVHAEIDLPRRNATCLNHTATHLLHAALKNILGLQVHQKGSLVDAKMARFDFSYNEALTFDQIIKIEALVNNKIRDNKRVSTEIMPLEAAKKIGAEALFGEKYSDSVRVLSVSDFSKELCGGTHVKYTGDIGLFKITSECGIANGVRRIEFMTGNYAIIWMNQQLNDFNTVAKTLKTTTAKTVEKLSQFLHDTKKQEKNLQEMQTLLAIESSKTLLLNVETINGVNILITQVKHNTDNLKVSYDVLKSQLDSAVIILFALDVNNINVLAGISKNILGFLPSAAVLVKDICGSGGGREDLAQGGGKLPSDLPKKIEAIKNKLAFAIKHKQEIS